MIKSKRQPIVAAIAGVLAGFAVALFLNAHDVHIFSSPITWTHTLIGSAVGGVSFLLFGLTANRNISPLFLVPVIVFALIALIPWFPTYHGTLPVGSAYVNHGFPWESILAVHLLTTTVVSAIIIWIARINRKITPLFLVPVFVFAFFTWIPWFPSMAFSSHPVGAAYVNPGLPWVSTLAIHLLATLVVSATVIWIARTQQRLATPQRNYALTIAATTGVVMVWAAVIAMFFDGAPGMRAISVLLLLGWTAIELTRPRTGADNAVK